MKRNSNIEIPGSGLIQHLKTTFGDDLNPKATGVTVRLLAVSCRGRDTFTASLASRCYRAALVVVDASGTSACLDSMTTAAAALSIIMPHAVPADMATPAVPTSTDRAEAFRAFHAPAPTPTPTEPAHGGWPQFYPEDREVAA